MKRDNKKPLPQRKGFYSARIPYTPLKINDKERVEIFYEQSITIVPSNITLLEEKKQGLVSRMAQFHNAVIRIAEKQKNSDFFIWFWDTYLTYFYAPKVVEINKKLNRLYLQRSYLQKDTSFHNSYTNFEMRKQQAKSCSLAEIAELHLEKIRFVGNRLTALCPFHREKTPSFTIYLQSNTYHCYGCHRNGDVITFKMGIDHLTFQQAIRALTL